MLCKIIQKVRQYKAKVHFLLCDSACVAASLCQANIVGCVKKKYFSLFIALVLHYLCNLIMQHFDLQSKYQPTGDQPEAIKELTAGVLSNTPAQVLLGVTGSGKTFTIANVIKNVNKPTLVLSHNKTLAAQLYTEFKCSIILRFVL